MRGLGWMFTVIQSVLLALALAGPLAPLPGVPAMPDGTDVKVVNSTAQAVYATGVVRSRALVMTTSNGKLPRNERVHLWIGIPVGGGSDDKNVVSITAMTSSGGTDILVGEGKDRVLLSQLLREAYNIRLEMR
jgi:hypothetical protein